MGKRPKDFTDARIDNSFMELNIVTKTIDLGDGRPVTIETGKLAKQAHGSVVVRQGDTMLLAAAVSNKEASEGVDFLPLTVDYREKYASTGRFPGGFFKREARPSDTEVLVMRLVDRALRPTFPEDYHAETQVMIQLPRTKRTCRTAWLVSPPLQPWPSVTSRSTAPFRRSVWRGSTATL